MVRIRLMGAFAHLAKARELEVKLEGQKTVDEILREVIPRYDEFHDKIVFINGKPAKGTALVEEGDEIKVMPVLSGG
ncbi:MoaD/ThiS family protein [Thermococcus argininiproducens]|uniref:MoaD/ThiS family protein n=1 Tax=Thermococcus argininiproducens TaxID=2866384 RepID=A0A9E7SBL6_9EURY|nr:MoaD/ThiS family protein [Thermococcus argininiproducens]USG99018.1 MoaD/ThiS family protein [Thermococcus argininiproducens]